MDVGDAEFLVGYNILKADGQLGGVFEFMGQVEGVAARGVATGLQVPDDVKGRSPFLAAIADSHVVSAVLGVARGLDNDVVRGAGSRKRARIGAARAGGSAAAARPALR